MSTSRPPRGAAGRRAGALALAALLAASPRAAGARGAVGGSAQAPSPALPAVPAGPDDAVSAALARHPDVRAAEAALAEARAVRSASSLLLANPELDIAFDPGPDYAELSASQPVSLSGEGWAARRSARHAVESAEARLRRVQLEVAAEARRAWVDAVVAARRAALAAEGASLASRLREAVERRVAAGEAPALDLQLARLAEARAAADALEARAGAAEAVRALATLAGPAALPPPEADPLDAAPEPQAPGAAVRSDVAAARAALRAAEAALARERAAALPPVRVGVFAERDGPTRLAGPAVGVEVPLFDRNQVGRAAARGAARVAEAKLRAVEARADAERRTARARLELARALQARLPVEDDLRSEAAQALAGIQAAWEAGEIDLLDAILLRSQVLDGEIAAIELRGGLAAARIDFLLAADDPRLLPAPRGER